MKRRLVIAGALVGLHALAAPWLLDFDLMGRLLAPSPDPVLLLPLAFLLLRLVVVLLLPAWLAGQLVGWGWRRLGNARSDQNRERRGG